MEILKCKCGNESFKVTNIYDCSICQHNGAYRELEVDGYEEHKYVYNEDLIKKFNLERNQIEEDGECQMGNGDGGGCSIFTCSKCELIKTQMSFNSSCG